MGDMADYYAEQGFLNELDGLTDEDYPEAKSREYHSQIVLKRRVEMAPRKAKRKYTRRNTATKKPVLIQVGKHFIAPNDIRCISAVKQGKLYIIKFYSEPNPEFPCFVTPEEIGKVLDQFEIVSGD